MFKKKIKTIWVNIQKLMYWVVVRVNTVYNIAVHVVGFVGRYHIPIVYIVNIDVGLFEAKGFSDNKLEEFSVITFG